MRDWRLWALTALYAFVYFALGTVKYLGHRNFVDLGIFTQTAASAFGCFCNTIEGSHFAFHFSPILYIAGALLLIWKSPLALVALQAVAGALTAPPIYAIVARRADRATALLAALVVLLYPPLAGVTFVDFHENGLAPAAVAWLAWAFDGGFAVLTILFAAVTLAIKEDQAIFLAAAGVFAAWRCRYSAVRLRLALGISVASLVLFVAYFMLIQPHASANPHWAPTRFYAWTAEDWRNLVPGGILQRIGYLLLAFVPLAFVPFRAPALIVSLLPLCEVLFSRMPTTFTMGTHYAGAWIGYVLFAFAVGVARIFAQNRQRAKRALYWAVALCVVEFAVANPLHPGYFLHPRAPRDAALDGFLATLPRDVDVATQEEAYTHLAAIDPNATLLPETDDSPVDACYILTDAAFAQSPRLVESAAQVRRLVRAGVYRAERHDGAITLYKASRSCG